MKGLFWGKEITSVAVSDIHDDWTVYKPGTLICAPRRAGKSTLLAQFAQKNPYCLGLHNPNIIIVPLEGFKKIQSYQLAQDKCHLPKACRDLSGDTYFMIDEIDMIWSRPDLMGDIPWDRVLCATTSQLSFDELQIKWQLSGDYPEYSWINHIVIQLPGLSTDADQLDKAVQPPQYETLSEGYA